MQTIVHYGRLIWFLAAFLIGMQIPAFVNQYGLTLNAHLQEAKLALDPFQQDADRFFEGDLEALIEHYQKSGDEVFIAGGESIATIYLRFHALEQAWSAFQSSKWSTYQSALMNPLTDIQSEVWENFDHVLVLNTDALWIGLVLAILLSLCCELACKATGKCCRLVMKKQSTLFFVDN
jgi:hypothetical protein